MLANRADILQIHGFPAFGEEKAWLTVVLPASLKPFPEKQGRFPLSHHHAVQSWHFLAPMTHRDRPCADFTLRLEKMYHEAGVSACWGDVKEVLLSQISQKY